MLQFITGESGSGKSIYIINKIAEDLRDGKRVILLVPEQHAVEAERKIEEIAVDVPTINLEVLNFKRLCNRVFREYGGLSYSYVGKGAQNLIMWRTLSTYLPFLKEYKDVAPTDKNFIKLMMQTIKELKNFSITPNILEQTADILIEDNRNLTNKLYDISLIYAKYDSILTGEYNAQTDELKLLSEISSENEFFKGYNIYIDSFSGFTMLEYEILRNMFKQADNIFVTMAVTSDSTNPIYAGIHYTLAQLKKIASNNHVEISEDIILTDKRRFNNGELKFLADNLNFSYTEDIYPTEPSNIAVYECNSIYAEAEAAAKDILKKVRHGARYNEVTVIMRDVSRYYGIIDAIFEKYEIPYFMSVRVDIATKPLIRLVISVLAIINNFWRVGDVISYIKTGLCGITYDECDILESYAVTWNINGNRWIDEKDWTLNPAGYTNISTERDKEILQTVNELRTRINAPVVKLSNVFEDNGTIKEVSAALYNFLIELNIPEQLMKRSDDSTQIWNSFVEALDQVVLAAQDFQVSAEEYIQLLMLVLNETDIGKIPASLDEVTIGNADKLRVGTVKHVYLLGVNDEIFPQPVSESSIFTENERIMLENEDVILTYDSNAKITDEYLHFYNAAVCASDTVTLIYSASDLSGKKQKPSISCEQIFNLFPALPIINYEKMEPLDLIEGYEASFEYTQILGREPIGTALKQIYSENEITATQLESCELPLGETEYKLSAEHSQNLYGGDIILTHSRIDNYVMCPFSYFCKYIMRLSEIRHAIFRTADVGTFIHRMLEIYLSRCKFDIMPTDDEIQAIINDIITHYKADIYGENDSQNKRYEHLFKRLGKNVFLLIQNLHMEFLQSSFIPRYFEVPVNFTNTEIASPYKIEFEDGTAIYISGVIDRIDTYSNGQRLYIRVIDYKTGTKDFSLDDIRIGLNLQMFLYLFSIWKNPGKKLQNLSDGNEILPAGILYFNAKMPDITIKSEKDREIVIDMAHEKLSRKGILLDDMEILQAMEPDLSGQFIPFKNNKASEKSLFTLEELDNLMENINNKIIEIGVALKSGNMSATPLQTNKYDACGYCANKPICRRDKLWK